MPANYVLLEKITVGAAGAASVTFSGIPQTGYTDLVVKMSDRQTFAQPYANWSIQFNGSGGTAYSRISLVGNGSSASSGSESGSSAIQIANSGQGNTATANTFSNWEIYIPNYTSANNKSVSIDSVAENNGTVAHATLWTGLWADTSAINSITIGVAGSGASFMQYSTFYLYGVAKLGTTPAIVPYATGGDTIMTDGTYWYHAFRSSGTFTPQKSITCDYLVVAGGASGGMQYAGGGGAGGLLTKASDTIALGSYTVTIGAGGAAASTAGFGNAGSNTTFNSITALGGGTGGYWSGTGFNGVSGGSGGGGGMGSNAGDTTTGGAATQGTSGGATGYGNAGGGGYRGTGSDYRGGGGGGAGVAGTSASASVTGNGGNGLSGTTVAFLNAMGSATSTGQLSGGNYFYAGGGGGATESSSLSTTGGLGGGGVGSFGGSGGSAAGAGTANTGSGGGGSLGLSSGAGGSGIVIIRYAV